MNKREIIVLIIAAILSGFTAALLVDIGIISGWYQIGLASLIGAVLWLGYLAKIIER